MPAWGFPRYVRTENNLQNPGSVASTFPVNVHNLQIKSCPKIEVCLRHVKK